MLVYGEHGVITKAYSGYSVEGVALAWNLDEAENLTLFYQKQLNPSFRPVTSHAFP